MLGYAAAKKRAVVGCQHALNLCTRALFEALPRRSPIGTPNSGISTKHCQALALSPGLSLRRVCFLLDGTDGSRPKGVFRLAREAVCGIGINIAASAVWGAPKLLARDYHGFAFHQVVETLPLDGRAAAMERPVPKHDGCLFRGLPVARVASPQAGRVAGRRCIHSSHAEPVAGYTGCRHGATSARPRPGAQTPAL